ncbi:putative asparagine synthetase [glutamine-hydrolyzing] [compost metagenome]
MSIWWGYWGPEFTHSPFELPATVNVWRHGGDVLRLGYMANPRAKSVTEPVRDTLTGSTCVFQGVITNRAELLDRLLARNVQIGNSDAALFLAAYHTYGHTILKELDGAFSVALFDPSQSKLLVARDALGKVPLYVARSAKGVVAWSTSLQVLAQGHWGTSNLDLEAISDYLHLGAFRSRNTLWKGVKAFPPAHLARISLSSKVTDWAVPECYWLPPDTDTPMRESGTAIVNHDETLLRELEQAMGLDQSVTLLLSGGVASAALGALLPKASERLTAVSLVPPSMRLSGNEALSKYLGLRTITVRWEDLVTEQTVRAGIEAMDLPSAEGLRTYILAAAGVRGGHSIVVSGHGGNEFHTATSYTVSRPQPNRFGSTLRSYVEVIRPSSTHDLNHPPHSEWLSGDLSSALQDWGWATQSHGLSPVLPLLGKRYLDTLLSISPRRRLGSLRHSQPLLRRLLPQAHGHLRPSRPEAFNVPLIAALNSADMVEPAVQALRDKLGFEIPVAVKCHSNSRLHLAYLSLGWLIK